MTKTYNSRSEFFEERIRQMVQEIAKLPKNDVLNINEQEYIDYLENEYRLTPIKVYRDQEDVREPRKIRHEMSNDPYTNPYASARYGGRNAHIIFEGYEIKVAYPFEGDAILFFVRPNTYSIGGASAKQIHIDESVGQIILTFEHWDNDSEKFNRDKDSAFDNEIGPLLTINPEVERFNAQLRSNITAQFHKRKNECLSENTFFRAINVRPADVPYKVSVPTVQKKQIPQPRVKNRKYETYPSMADEMYVDILKTLYSAGQAMERKPSTYMNKGEEALRDLFIFRLEDRYDSATVTGETFNFGGKTDICLKDSATNANLFIAECKIWHGAKAFSEAIDQLFDRYLTVRDSKVALMFFVAGNEFNSVLSTIKQEAPKHKYFVSFTGEREKSSFSFIFRLPTDSEQKVYFEIMAFHFPKA